MYIKLPTCGSYLWKVFSRFQDRDIVEVGNHSPMRLLNVYSWSSMLSPLQTRLTCAFYLTCLMRDIFCLDEVFLIRVSLRVYQLTRFSICYALGNHICLKEKYNDLFVRGYINSCALWIWMWCSLYIWSNATEYLYIYIVSYATFGVDTMLSDNCARTVLQDLSITYLDLLVIKDFSCIKHPTWRHHTSFYLVIAVLLEGICFLYIDTT